MSDMCKAVEEYGDEREKKGKDEGKIEGKIETVKNMLKDGFGIDLALKYTGLDRQTYEKYAAQV